ncbi:MAG: WG repeat-containing protein [Treponema sp.]|nr:WG repeat-containing protein [Treponema sp.]
MKKTLVLLFTLIAAFALYAKEFSLFKYKNLYGIIDNNRKVILSPQYESITKNSKSYYLCYDSEENVFIYNPKMELIYSIEEKASLTRFSDYEYILKKWSDPKFYLLNLKTLEISDYEKSEDYIYEYAYADDLALVCEIDSKNFSYSIADIKGNIILRDIEQADIIYSDGLIAVQMENGKSGFVDKKGNFVIETQFYRNKAEEGPKKYPALSYFFNEGFAIVQTEKDVWKILDKKGKETLIPSEIDLINLSFSKGLVVVKDSQGKYGYMNTKAKLEIPYDFDSASNFIGKYAMVVYKGEDAVINKKGKIILCKDIMLK